MAFAIVLFGLRNSGMFMFILQVPYIIYAETDQGSPGAAITRIAKENNMTMVILGTRAFGMLKRAVLGSTSDYVVHHAHCPVTVIPPPLEKKEEKAAQ